MSIDPQYENEIRRLLHQNKRAEAARYLQNVLNVSNTDAERLVQAVEHEITLENQRAITTVTTQAPGCGAVLLRVLSFGFGFFGIGFIILGVGVYFLFNYVDPEAVEIQGHVIALKENDTGSFAPVIEYQWEGVTKTHESEVYSSPPEYHVGQAVSVWIDPDNPETATVVFTELGWIFIYAFGGIGLFFLIIALVLNRVRKNLGN